MVRLGEFNLGTLQGTHLMNNQIKYLAIKAGLDIDGFGYPIWGSLESEDEKKEFLEKFADLIIKDCICACIADIADPRDTVELDCAKKIKKHFGVEE